MPKYCHQQTHILHFMQDMYALNQSQKRILAYLYRQSSIRQRYSVLDDFSNQELNDRQLFIDRKENPSVAKRMELYQLLAPQLAFSALQNCLEGVAVSSEITHLITVSCTGMCAPGIDLQLVEMLQMPKNIFRTSVNFMGCYAAIHALKMANYICNAEPNALVAIVAVELCTIHFQPKFSEDNASSSMLFADGAAAVLVSNQSVQNSLKAIVQLNNFYSSIESKGKNDMAWKIGNNGFEMTLSSFIPTIIESDIDTLVTNALEKNNLLTKDITHWCIHPGGRKIIDVVEQKLQLLPCKTIPSRYVLENYGNMSSPSILFVLNEIIKQKPLHEESIFGVAFGPGLTMETFTATLI
ncbi:type III polyketide synthase [Hydrotalea sp.]|uniref:type III polyketide synthase n=1 Tax=Hydrotalea sp. TaxID=2881279 RepID=UPI003D0AE718